MICIACWLKFAARMAPRPQCRLCCRKIITRHSPAAHERGWRDAVHEEEFRRGITAGFADCVRTTAVSVWWPGYRSYVQRCRFAGTQVGWYLQGRRFQKRCRRCECELRTTALYRWHPGRGLSGEAHSTD